MLTPFKFLKRVRRWANYMVLSKRIEAIRRWIDGEPAPIIITIPDKRQRSLDYTVALMRAVDIVMQEELYSPPNGSKTLPLKYVIFISPEDDNQWPGQKRTKLIQAIQDSLLKKAAEYTRQKLSRDALSIYLTVAGTFRPGEVWVKALWDDAEPLEATIPHAAETEINVVPTIH